MVYRIFTCTFPVLSLQCYDILTLQRRYRKVALQYTIHYFLLFSTSDSSLTVTSVFKTTVSPRKFLPVCYRVQLIFFGCIIILSVTKHSSNRFQCRGNLSVPKKNDGCHLGFLKLKVSP